MKSQIAFVIPFFCCLVVPDLSSADSVCIDRNATVEIALMSMQSADLAMNADDPRGNMAKSEALDRKIAALAQKYCGKVNQYPRKLTTKDIGFGCSLFSGTLTISSAARTVFWTTCPDANE